MIFLGAILVFLDIISIFLLFLIDLNTLHFEAKQKAYLFRPNVTFYKNLLYKIKRFLGASKYL